MVFVSDHCPRLQGVFFFSECVTADDTIGSNTSIRFHHSATKLGENLSSLAQGAPIQSSYPGKPQNRYSMCLFCRKF